MFKIKRPIIVGLLLVLLFFTGYLNYQLTQQAIVKTSKNYQRHEKTEMARNDNLNVDLGEKDNKREDEFEVVDSMDLDNQEITKVLNEQKDNLKVELDKDLDKELDKKVTNLDRNYFVEQRLSRDKLRGTLVDRLDKIIKDEKSESVVIKEAQQEIIKIGKVSEKELQIEGVIKSKGFEEAIVFINEEEIKVVVSTNDLNQQEMVKILDVVKSETDMDIDKIKIMNKE
jgi:stage III sporulation protein AH